MLTSSNSFLEAVETLRQEKLIAPVYYILAGQGPSEGVVITRSRTACLDVWLLNSHNSTRGGNLMQPWYLLETNYVSATKYWYCSYCITYSPRDVSLALYTHSLMRGKNQLELPAINGQVHGSMEPPPLP